MLVLSRKNGQTIVIDGQISVQVIRIEGNQVRIGISAPKDVRILRGELPSKSEFSEEIAFDLRAGDRSPLAKLVTFPVSQAC